ncbi:MAG: hypothetical protein EPN82_09010 [Bacteroidetes bacterium]|nr:MAG: hypothetical protein EPN82_09010 [Bacteroidota bacterium]
MKNTFLHRIFLLSTLIIILSSDIISQVISFTAYNSRSLKPVKLDSIYIINFTTNIDTMLIGRDTIDLSDLTDVIDNYSGNGNSTQISQCYPSCFETGTQFSIFNPEYNKIKIIVSNSLGSVLAQYEDFLSDGCHNFTFAGGNLQHGIYFITLLSNYNTQTVKVIKFGEISNNSCSINYQGETSKFITEVFYEGDKYSYKVFARGYKPLDMSEPADVYDGENFAISLKPLSNFDFTRVDVEVFNISGIFENKSQFSGDREPNIWYDTMDIELSFSFKDSLPNYNIFSGHGIEYFDCRNIISNGDSIGICKEEIIDGQLSGNFKTNSIYITAYYDNDNVLMDINFVKSDKWHHNFQDYFTDDSINELIIDNMSCYYDSNSNLFCIKIIKIENIKIERNYLHVGGITINGRTSKLVSIMAKDDLPNLFIKFIK